VQGKNRIARGIVVGVLDRDDHAAAGNRLMKLGPVQAGDRGRDVFSVFGKGMDQYATNIH
jgi:hypothetical protein